MTQGTSIQPAYIAGELAPAMWGRTDNEKYKIGSSTMRNGFANFQGGWASRGGLAYVGMIKQAAPNAGTSTVDNVSGGTPVNSGPPRDIPFQFSVLQGFILEFGDFYMRVKYRGAYVTETGKNVTAITQANPGIISITAHGFSDGDWVFGAAIGGMTDFNGLTWIVQNATADTFTLTDLFGNDVNTNLFSPYTSGGTFARIYTTTTIYAAADLKYLKFTQSADQMSLTCWNQQTLTEYPPVDLTRMSNTNWVFTEVTFSESIDAPANAAATAQSSTTLNTWYSYVITAVNAATSTESVASNVASVQNNDISVNAGSNTITWSPVAGASSYNIYAAIPYYATGAYVPQIGVPFGYLGTALGTSFVDSNITPDFTATPPLHTDPFAKGGIVDVVPTAAGSGLDQSTVGYTVNTSTGSGFSGTPIILNGGLNGFYIADTGHDYAPGDTISITGGPASAATGFYNFTSGNPTGGQDIVLNGVTWTFVASGATGNQTNIQGTLSVTLLQLALDLNNSIDPGISDATYNVSGNFLNITYGTTGTAGNAYTLALGSYPGAVSNTTLLGGSAAGGTGGAAVAVTIGPETGTWPGTVAYFQQRRTYAGTENNPDTYYLTQPGDYTNMDSSIPAVDNDAIIGTPWGQQVNGVQFLTPMPGGLVIWTGSGAWLLSGGNSTAITPAQQDAQPQSRYGCSATLPPIPINFNILFVRENDGIVYNLQFNFWVNIYQGTDMTVFSSHLFEGYTLVEWAYSEKPYKLVWVVRSDGTLLSLTYIAEQNEQGWARHDTNGLFIGVCAIEEPPVDAVYVIVQRYIQGVWVYYSERFDNRIWPNAESCFCVDSGLAYPMTFPAAILYAAAANGTDNITSVHIAAGGMDYTNPHAEAVDETGTGTGATFLVTIAGGKVTAIVPLTTGSKYTQGQTNIVITDPTGHGCKASPIITNYVTFNAPAAPFTPEMVGDVIRTGNGNATIVTYTSASQVIANVTAPITAVLQNDPDRTPIPQPAGQWSISTPTTVVKNLNHLNGKTVTGLADGGVINPVVVQNGRITLLVAASQICVGMAFLPQLQTLSLDVPTPNTIQTKRKNIPSVGLRVHASRGASIGSNQPDASAQPGNVNVPWENMVPVKELNSTVPAGQNIPLMTGDYFINIGPDWNIRGKVAFQQSYPLPLNIDAHVSYYNVGDTGEPS